MKIIKITHSSSVDGEGIRSVIWFAGCGHSCKGCHNPETWNIHSGVEMTISEIIRILRACSNNRSA